MKIGPEETPRLPYLRFASVTLYPSNEDLSLAIGAILRSFSYPSASLVCAKVECEYSLYSYWLSNVWPPWMCWCLGGCKCITCLPTVCVCVCFCVLMPHVGVLAHSQCLGGHDCCRWTLTLTVWSWSSVCCQSSEHGSHHGLPIHYSCPHTLSLIHLRGLLAQTNLINIFVSSVFQYWKNLEDIWFNLPGAQRTLTSRGIQSLVTSHLYFRFERVCYWSIMHSPTESHKN